MITTTLNRIHEHWPNVNGWTTLLDGLGKTSADDEPLPFATILEINGLDDAHARCRAEPQYDREWRLLMVAYARRVQHLNTNPIVKNAIDVAERYANGEATDGELKTARDAIWSATYDVASNAYGLPANAEKVTSWIAAWASKAAAEALAEVSARAVSAAAANALQAVRLEAENNIEIAARTKKARMDAGWAATVAEHKWQKQEFLRVVTETEARAP